MEKSNRKYQLYPIDHIWYVAERVSERKHNNLKGGNLLFCVGSLLYSYRFSYRWIFAASVGLLPLPQ